MSHYEMRDMRIHLMYVNDEIEMIRQDPTIELANHGTLSRFHSSLHLWL